MRIAHAHSLMLIYVVCLYGAVCALAWSHWFACVRTGVGVYSPSHPHACARVHALWWGSLLYLKQCMHVQIMDDHSASCISKTGGCYSSRVRFTVHAYRPNIKPACAHLQYFVNIPSRTNHVECMYEVLPRGVIGFRIGRRAGNASVVHTDGAVWWETNAKVERCSFITQLAWSTQKPSQL